MGTLKLENKSVLITGADSGKVRQQLYFLHVTEPISRLFITQVMKMRKKLKRKLKI